MDRNSVEINQKRNRMDGETAIAFAIECFQRFHSRESCPSWLSRCTTIGHHWDELGNYVVSFALTPKATNDGVSYFKVSVNPSNAETQVLLDRTLSDFVGPDLQGY